VVTLLDNQSGSFNEVNGEFTSIGLGISTDVTCGTNWPPYSNSCNWDPKKIYTSMINPKEPWGVAWWPIYACNGTYDPVQRKRTDAACAGADIDTGLNKFQFINESGYLRELLTGNSGSGKKRFIYFHCMQGTDRTGALHVTYMLDNNPSMTFKKAVERATIGARQGSDDQQLTPELKPMCTYISLAHQYCLAQNSGNQARCEVPDGAFKPGSTFCRF
jgi:hypothetical protein